MANTFDRFGNLPVEIQVQIFQTQIDSLAEAAPRLVLVHTRRTTNNTLSANVLNSVHLQDTDNVRPVAQSSEVGRLAAIAHIRRERLARPWLQRLRLSQYHVDPAVDIVFLGGIRGYLNPSVPSMAPSMVLGHEFPNIMVNANRWMSYVGHSTTPPEPVATAITQLADLRGVYASYFTPWQLPRPALPQNFYFFVGLYQPSPCANLAHNPQQSDWCVHYSHLQIAPEDEVDQWTWFLDAQLRSPDPMLERTQALIGQIREYWQRLREQDAFQVRVPNIFFARIPREAMEAGVDDRVRARWEDRDRSVLGQVENLQGQVDGPAGRRPSGGLVRQLGRPQSATERAPDRPVLGERRREGEGVREWLARVVLPAMERQYVEKYRFRGENMAWVGVTFHSDSVLLGGPSAGQLRAFRDWTLDRLTVRVEAEIVVAERTEYI